MTLSYTEPHLPELLTLLSFLYFLQVFRHLLQYLTGAGLLGEIIVGIVYGVAGILPLEWEETFLIVGYLGLILIVFEGGLDFQPHLFIPSLPLGTVCALTGVLVPLALSFGLFYAAFSFTALSAFSSGVALASTSLGTTLFVLSKSPPSVRLNRTKIANVLISAALVDDVIALVLLSVLQSLAGSSSSGGAGLGWTVGRPVVASLGMAVVGPLVGWYLIRPLWTWSKLADRAQKRDVGNELNLAVGTVLLSGFLAVSYYIQTTPLLGAYISGVVLTMLTSSPSQDSRALLPPTFPHTFHHLVAPIQTHLFTPLFFASIGYTIPFVQLWTGKIIWRGIVFSLLMAFAKLIVGVWILGTDCISVRFTRIRKDEKRGEAMELSTLPTTSASPSPRPSSRRFPSLSLSFVRPTSTTLPTSFFIGLALVSRGEIGLLILQSAFAANQISGEAYLISIWAVGVCTIVGPIGTGWVVKRYGEVIKGDQKWGELEMDKEGRKGKSAVVEDELRSDTGVANEHEVAEQDERQDAERH